MLHSDYYPLIKEIKCYSVINISIIATFGVADK